jgi:hypothetical protein
MILQFKKAGIFAEDGVIEGAVARLSTLENACKT